MAPDVATPPPHSKRVEAWVYAIMNPLIESLGREIRLLSEGNLSWRSYSKRCEYIRPIREYIEISQWPNYEDFLADNLNPGFKERFERHDHQVSEAESAAARLFIGLTDSNEFQKQVKDSLEEYESAARGKPQYPDLSSIGENLRNVVAELLVNRTQLLPSHYMTHKFWQDYRGRFEHHKQSPSFQELDVASATLQGSSKNLVSDLENHRHLLCVTFDIPAAPITIEKSIRADAYLA